MPATPPSFPSAASSKQTSDRRETILSLVELLLKNNNEGLGHGNHQLPSFEDDKDVPSVDEHIQAAGAETFHQLERKINNLDKELRNFANAARQLGSSVAILSSAYQLRTRLAYLLYLLRENAADLFPRRIVRQAKDANIGSPISSRRRTWGIRRVKGKAQLHVPRPAVSDHLDLEAFPEELELLAQGVTTFLRCLNEFPEFTDEAVNASIMSFEGDLNYWASCLREYAGQFRYAAVQRYIHDLSSEIGEHMDELTSSLSMFIEVGVPMIRFAQQHGADNLLNLSTVATFFSAVTATTLQFSYELKKGGVADSVNVMWFLSMVFSIAAAVNSLLGLTWKQAMYRSPGHRVPWWVLIWIKRSPLVFLVLSVACFSIGLCCFAYASDQAKITSTLTTVLTAFTSFGLAAVSAWFASERWAFSRHRGQKWLSDVLDEMWARMWMMPGIHWMQTTYSWTGTYMRRMHSGVLGIFHLMVLTCVSCWTRAGNSGHGHGDDDDGEGEGRERKGDDDDLEANKLKKKLKMKMRDDMTLPMHASDVDGSNAAATVANGTTAISASPAPITKSLTASTAGIEPPPAAMVNPGRTSFSMNNAGEGSVSSPRASISTGTLVNPDGSTTTGNNNFGSTSNPNAVTTTASSSIIASSPSSPPQPSSSTSASPPGAGKQRWKAAIKNVGIHRQQQQLQSPFSLPLASSSTSAGGASTSQGPVPVAGGASSSSSTTSQPTPLAPPISLKSRPDPVRKRTTSSSYYHALNTGNLGGGTTGAPGVNFGPLSPVGGGMRNQFPMQYTQSRVASLVPKLNELEATHDLAAHSALVRHMQFSPDGKWLASSSWDKTAVIFKVGNPFVPHRTLAHAQGFVGQVAWSPAGKYLLTKMARGVKVWTVDDGVCKKTIDRAVPIETISWFPCGEAFLSVEDSWVTKLDLQGNVLDQYEFPSMKILDAAITPDSSRLIVVGPRLKSPTGLQPSKSRVEKRIVIYNMQTKQVETTTPILNDVKDITLVQASRSGLNALISYEHKAPPQLWKVEVISREAGTSTARISLRHTYMPKTPVDFIGPSYFGGRNNELVLCASKGGDIHIWDQESGALLHSIRARPHGGDLTCIAWNHAMEDPFIFATGTHDGAVRVWSRHPDDVPDTGLDYALPPHSRLGHIPRLASPYSLGYNASESTLDHHPMTSAAVATDIKATASSSRHVEPDNEAEEP